MLRWAVSSYNGPVAVRYPRGGNGEYTGSAWNGNDKLCCHRKGEKAAIVVYGTMLQNAMDAANLLEDRGISVSVIRLLTVEPLPAEALAACLPDHMPVFVVEEVCSGSGIREALAWELAKYKPDCKVHGLDLGKNYVAHGGVKTLYKHCGIDHNAIADTILEVLKGEN